MRRVVWRGIQWIIAVSLVLCWGACASAPSQPSAKATSAKTLVQAATEGDLSRVRDLLARKDAPSLDEQSQAVLGAAEQGHPAIVELFCQNPSIRPWVFTIALTLAAGRNQPEVVALLLEKGVAVDAEADILGTPVTALSAATSKDQRAMARFLLDQGANPNYTRSDGTTPLIDAALYDRTEIAQMLIDRKAEVNPANRPTLTPLIAAILRNSQGVFRLLLANNVDVNATDPNGNGPLGFAVYEGKEEMVRLLIAQGADVRAKNKIGQTPLMIAVERKNDPMVEILFRAQVEQKKK